MKDWAYEIIEEFFEMRRYRGWTIRYAARLIGVSFSYLAAVENKDKVPSKNLLQRMVVFLINDQLENKKHT